jgi:glutathione-regulated potassium-efflux system ancillary protein KefG
MTLQHSTSPQLMPTPNYILLAHPDLQHSKVNRAMSRAAGLLESVHLVDLYDAYPDFLINVAREHRNCEAAARIVLQFPMYWYGAPAMVAQWCEEVLTPGFAHGKDGHTLAGKTLQVAVSTGRSRGDGTSPAAIEAEVAALLTPFRLTAHYCGMTYAAPLIYLANPEGALESLDRHIAEYVDLLATEAALS